MLHYLIKYVFLVTDFELVLLIAFNISSAVGNEASTSDLLVALRRLVQPILPTFCVYRINYSFVHLGQIREGVERKVRFGLLGQCFWWNGGHDFSTVQVKFILR